MAHYSSLNQQNFSLTPQTSSTTGSYHSSTGTDNTEQNPFLAPQATRQVTETKRTYSYVFSEWPWDILSWLLCAIIIAAIIALMIIFHGKTVSEWHSKIRISTIVACLSQSGTDCFSVSRADDGLTTKSISTRHQVDSIT